MIWEKYEELKLPEPKLKANPTIRQVMLEWVNIGDKECRYLTIPKYPNLRELVLCKFNLT